MDTRGEEKTLSVVDKKEEEVTNTQKVEQIQDTEEDKGAEKGKGKEKEMEQKDVKTAGENIGKQEGRAKVEEGRKGDEEDKEEEEGKDQEQCPKADLTVDPNPTSPTPDCCLPVHTNQTIRGNLHRPQTSCTVTPGSEGPEASLSETFSCFLNLDAVSLQDSSDNLTS